MLLALSSPTSLVRFLVASFTAWENSTPLSSNLPILITAAARAFLSASSFIPIFSAPGGRSAFNQEGNSAFIIVLAIFSAPFVYFPFSAFLLVGGAVGSAAFDSVGKTSLGTPPSRPVCLTSSIASFKNLVDSGDNSIISGSNPLVASSKAFQSTNPSRFLNFSSISKI